VNRKKNKGICPVEKAGGLDNSIRKLLQNPRKIVKPYINEGMTVLDLGCGPGFFSIEIAKLLIDSGKVIAADLQEGMLDKVKRKIKGTEFEKRIAPHKCAEESIDLNEKVDFILAFYMIHEVPNQDKLFRELKSIVKPNGQIFIVEPIFHVSKNSFNLMIDRLTKIGFEIEDRPTIFFSRAIVLKNKE
jgi:ubiquinone/menaquinone biosynthesis C-methylase UbiE